MAQTISLEQAVAPAILLSLDQVYGNNNARMRVKMRTAGTLDAVLSDANVLANPVQMEKVIAPVNTGNIRRLRTWYRPRRAAGTSSSTQNPCPTGCSAPTFREQYVEIEGYRQECEEISAETIKALYEEAGKMTNGTFTMVAPRNSPVPPPVMNIIADGIIDLIGVVRRDMANDILSALNAASPTFVFAGPTPTAAPLNMVLTDVNGDRLRPGGFLKLIDEIDKADWFDNVIALHGLGPFQKAMNLVKMGCCSADGVDIKALSQQTRIVPYLDNSFNSIYKPASNPTEFLAWIPGAIQLLVYNDYSTGNTALVPPYSGTMWRFTVPDPIHGNKLAYDVSLKYNECVGALGSYTMTVGIHFTTWICPADRFLAGDDLENFRDVFPLAQSAEDLCFNPC